MVFSNYQKYFQNGVYVGEGNRGEFRFKLIDWDLIKGRSILDLGCANGMLTIEAKRMGASRALGIDVGDWIPDVRDSVKAAGIDAEFWQIDMESREFKQFCPQFDITFFCSMIGHLKDPIEMLRWIDIHTKYFLYFESNLGENNKAQIELIEKYTSFIPFRELGSTAWEKQEGIRYMWFCARNGVCNTISVWRDSPVTFLPMDKIICSLKANLNSLPEYHKLKENIKLNGLMQPLICCEFINQDGVREGDSYMIREGGKRYHILKELEYKNLPCRIVQPGPPPKSDIIIKPWPIFLPKK